MFILTGSTLTSVMMPFNIVIECSSNISVHTSNYKGRKLHISMSYTDVVAMCTLCFSQ